MKSTIDYTVDDQKFRLIIEDCFANLQSMLVNRLWFLFFCHICRREKTRTIEFLKPNTQNKTRLFVERFKGVLTSDNERALTWMALKFILNNRFFEETIKKQDSQTHSVYCQRCVRVRVRQQPSRQKKQRKNVVGKNNARESEQTN